MVAAISPRVLRSQAASSLPRTSWDSPSLKDPLALHPQLEPALDPHRIARGGLIGERWVEPDLVRCPLDRGIIDGHGHLSVPDTAGVLRLQKAVRGPAPLRGLPGARPDVIHNRLGRREVAELYVRLCQEQQQIRIPV